jgi:hypothetical protein
MMVFCVIESCVGFGQQNIVDEDDLKGSFIFLTI